MNLRGFIMTCFPQSEGEICELAQLMVAGLKRDDIFSHPPCTWRLLNTKLLMARTRHNIAVRTSAELEKALTVKQTALRRLTDAMKKEDLC
jgi:hypothetical protein